MYRFVQCVLSEHLIPFLIFSVSVQFLFFVFRRYEHGKSVRRFTSFRIFSVYLQIHSMYLPNVPTLIWLFRIKLFSSQLSKEHCFKKWSQGELMDLKLTKKIFCFVLEWQINYFCLFWLNVKSASIWLSGRIRIYIRYELRVWIKVGASMEKTGHEKYHACVTF
jgi:hypothetical protein